MSSTVFVGGSRHISRLSPEARDRLNNIIGSGFRVVVGDAAGADKAVQKHLLESGYNNITVFCSGDVARNNLGNWELCKISTPSSVKGFQFYAAKDREMASRADFGLMIWDGKSPGTALNVLRLVKAGKKALLLNIPKKKALAFTRLRDWLDFLAHCTPDLIQDLRSRAAPEEWVSLEHRKDDSVVVPRPQVAEVGSESDLIRKERALTAEINAAFASGDISAVMEKLGNIAKAYGMSQIAKETGLARESLYRSLNNDGNPEFSTVMKVISSLGLRLSVSESGKAANHPRMDSM